jgi:hypothetical protein
VRSLVAAFAATIAVACAGCDHASSGGSGAADHTSLVTSSESPAASVSSPVATSIATPLSLTFSDKSGTVKIGQGAVDPSTLGVPLYPGAVQEPSGSSSSTAADGSTEITTLSTGDAYSSVNAWYKAHLPADAQATNLSVEGESTSSYQWSRNAGRENRVVTISTNHGKPVITISVTIATATSAP